MPLTPDRPADGATTRASVPTVRHRISNRLLIITMLAVMLAEVLIFVPSIANFREEWLSDRIATVAVAGLASRGRDSEDTAPLSPDEEAGLLRALDALLVAIIEGNASRLLARDPRLDAVDLQIDLGNRAHGTRSPAPSTRCSSAAIASCGFPAPSATAPCWPRW
ncbi:MAG: hypothetical protein CL626_06215 [Aurantimonas sp.]|nr:hypothetical protein [Aurantimonas sp.]